MTVSLILSTYNSELALELCLKSILKQSVMPCQIVIADDGSSDATRRVIESYARIAPFVVVHAWHPDDGFRLAKIRNMAIAQCTGDYIIQIDGDVILHRHFVKDHLKIAKYGYFITGVRVNMGIDLSKKLLESQSINVKWWNKDLCKRHYGIRCRLLCFCFRNHKRLSFHHGLGSNMAFLKSDLMTINGYNENFEGWGCEDHDLTSRLMNMGVKKRTLKFSGIQFHIHHQGRTNLNSVERNDQIHKQTILNKTTFCNDGIQKIEQNGKLCISEPN